MTLLQYKVNITIKLKGSKYIMDQMLIKWNVNDILTIKIKIIDDIVTNTLISFWYDFSLSTCNVA